MKTNFAPQLPSRTFASQIWRLVLLLVFAIGLVGPTVPDANACYLQGLVSGEIKLRKRAAAAAAAGNANKANNLNAMRLRKIRHILDKFTATQWQVMAAALGCPIPQDPEDELEELEDKVPMPPPKVDVGTGGRGGASGQSAMPGGSATVKVFIYGKESGCDFTVTFVPDPGNHSGFGVPAPVTVLGVAEDEVRQICVGVPVGPTVPPGATAKFDALISNNKTGLPIPEESFQSFMVHAASAAGTTPLSSILVEIPTAVIPIGSSSTAPPHPTVEVELVPLSLTGHIVNVVLTQFNDPASQNINAAAGVAFDTSSILDSIIDPTSVMVNGVPPASMSVDPSNGDITLSGVAVAGSGGGGGGTTVSFDTSSTGFCDPKMIGCCGVIIQDPADPLNSFFETAVYQTNDDLNALVEDADLVGLTFAGVTTAGGFVDLVIDGHPFLVPVNPGDDAEAVVAAIVEAVNDSAARYQNGLLTNAMDLRNTVKFTSTNKAAVVVNSVPAGLVVIQSDCPPHFGVTGLEFSRPFMVDSFFDITYKIEFVGLPGGQSLPYEVRFNDVPILEDVLEVPAGPVGVTMQRSVPTDILQDALAQTIADALHADSPHFLKVDLVLDPDSLHTETAGIPEDNHASLLLEPASLLALLGAGPVGGGLTQFDLQLQGLPEANVLVQGSNDLGTGQPWNSVGMVGLDPAGNGALVDQAPESKLFFRAAFPQTPVDGSTGTFGETLEIGGFPAFFCCVLDGNPIVLDQIVQANINLFPLTPGLVIQPGIAPPALNRLGPQQLEICFQVETLAGTPFQPALFQTQIEFLDAGAQPVWYLIKTNLVNVVPGEVGGG